MNNRELDVGQMFQHPAIRLQRLYLASESMTGHSANKTIAKKNPLTFWKILHALKCDLKLKRVSERTRVVQHSYV